MVTFTFFDYLSINNINPIREWLNGFHKKTRIKVKVKLVLATVFANTLGRLQTPHFKLLHGEDRDLIEVRFQVKGVAYRPHACYGPERGQVVFLVDAVEVNDRIVPPGTRDIARRRMEELLRDPRRMEPTCIFEKNN